MYKYIGMTAAFILACIMSANISGSIPVTRSTDLFEGPQNSTILFSPPLEHISLLIEQKISIRTTPVKVFPVPAKIEYKN